MSNIPAGKIHFSASVLNKDGSPFNSGVLNIYFACTNTSGINGSRTWFLDSNNTWPSSETIAKTIYSTGNPPGNCGTQGIWDWYFTNTPVVSGYDYQMYVMDSGNQTIAGNGWEYRGVAPINQVDLINTPNIIAINAIQSGLATPTNITAGTITNVTNLTNNHVDLIDAPNTIAISAIQNGLATPTNIIAASGVVLAANGLDSISTTAPAGVASNFREMLIQVWRRFFHKTTCTATQLKTYDNAGTGVITTQTISDDNTTQTQGKAS